MQSSITAFEIIYSKKYLHTYRMIQMKNGTYLCISEIPEVIVNNYSLFSMTIGVGDCFKNSAPNDMVLNIQLHLNHPVVFFIGI